MKRLALRFIGSILLLLGLFIGLLGLLLGTEAGTGWLLGQVQSLAPGMIRIGASQGRFMGRLELADVGLKLATAEIGADSLVLDWSPRRLLRGEFIVNELSLAELRFAGQPVEDPPPAEPLQWPIELPAISPPLRVVLSRVELTDVELITAPEATPLIIDKALLQAHWDDEGIVLEKLESSGPTHSLAIEGQIDPLDAYATLLDNQVTVAVGAGIQLNLQGRIEGNTQRLETNQRLTGDVQLGLSASLDKPLEKPEWQALLQLQALPGELLSADLPMTLAGDINVSGDLNSAALTGQLHSSSKTAAMDRLQLQLDVVADVEQQSLNLKRVELKQQDQPLSIALRGEATAEALDIQGEWAALQWPLAALKPTIRSQQGQLSLRGPLDDYHLELSADLAAQDIVEGNWQLVGDGNKQQLKVKRLDGGLLGGTLGVEGQLGWSPQVSWDLDATARKLKPERWLADPDAVVHLAATTSGTVGDAGPQARLVLQSLGGRLNGQPLTGQGELSYSAEQIQIDHLRINNADALLTADGLISEQSDLKWRLQVPNLGELVADAAGRVSSQGRVSGARQTPRIVGDVNVDGLALAGLRVDSLVGDVDLDLQDRRRSQLAVSAETVAFGDNGLEQLKLGLDGFIRQHQLTMQALHSQGAIDLAANGGYEKLWSGKLTRFDLDTKALGPWHLQRPVALSLAAQNVSAEPLCLLRERAHLCAQGAWQTDGEFSGKFDLAALPLSWLQVLFPEQIKGASGVLSASGEVSQARTLRAHVQAALTPGDLLLEGASEDVRVPHQDVSFTLDAEGQGANASLRAGVGKSRVQAKIGLPDLLAVSDKQQARIKAELHLDAPDFQMLPLLVPSVSRVKGKLRADFDVRGTLGAPQLGGPGQLRMPELELDQLGLALKDTRVDLGVTNNTLTLDGSTLSGGRLTLQGGLLLDGGKGWPLSLGVKGQDFVVADVPNLMLAISPDIKVQRGADSTSVTGTLTVPAAEILIRDLPSGSRSASPDIVIVGADGVGDEHTEETTPFDTSITLVLGDKVHLAALGLDAFLRGELALRGVPDQPLRATGDLRLDDGVFRAYGQRLEIERGLFSFAKSPLDNPGVNVRAVRTVGDVEVGVNALGTVKEMIVTTFSSPSMSENDRISYLVTGKPAREGASLSLDRQIANNLTVGVSVDTDTGDRAFLTRYRLHRTLYTEVSSSARSSALDLFYTVERK